MLEQNHLKVYIRDLIAALEEEQDIDMDVVLLQLQGFRDQIETLNANFSAQATGAGELQKRIQDVFQHFTDSLEHLEDFVDEMDMGLLEQAHLKSEAGDTKLRELIALCQSESSENQVTG